ncbi:hypothetical protein NC651_013003 [Populus alba x Populus x berolinensis]|nr:hypothetical protein NC651_013003 [Populus alba x Populus x berolinensis]
MLQSLFPSQRKQFMLSTQSHDPCQNTCEIHGKPALLQSTFSATTLIETITVTPCMILAAYT